MTRPVRTVVALLAAALCGVLAFVVANSTGAAASVNSNISTPAPTTVVLDRNDTDVKFLGEEETSAPAGRLTTRLPALAPGFGRLLPSCCVAAEEVGGLAPQLDKAFQFGGAGRSGAGVKNFVGPPSAVVRGASPGRIFVTDDEGRVIFDITRDRVKPVIPGQGFISGDGRKLTPTQEQLSWIDELWGG